MVSWVPVCNRTKRVCLFLSLSSCTVDFLVKAAEFDVGKEGIREYEEHRILPLCLFFVSSSSSSSALKNLLLMFSVFPKLSIFIAVPLWRPLDFGCHSHIAFQVGLHLMTIHPFLLLREDLQQSEHCTDTLFRSCPLPLGC